MKETPTKDKVASNGSIVDDTPKKQERDLTDFFNQFNEGIGNPDDSRIALIQDNE